MAPATLLKAKKKPKLSTSEKAAPTIRTGYQELRDVMQWREKGWSKALKEAICDKLLQWAQLQDSNDFASFCSSFGMPDTTFDYQIQNDKDVKHVYDVAKTMIGARRLQYAEQKQFGFNEGAVTRTLRLFHRDWKKCHDDEVEFAKWKIEKAAEAKAKEQAEQSGNGIKVVYIPQFGDVPSVPMKKDE